MSRRNLSSVRVARRQRVEKVGFNYEAQPKQSVALCNLCGNQYLAVLAQHDRYGFSAQAHVCLCCGLVFLNPVMTRDAYRSFYKDIYRPLVSAYHGRRIDAEAIQAEQRVYAAECAELVEDYVSSGGFVTLLDVGGSTGVLAHYFAQRFALRATVLDPSPLEVEHARRLGLETIVGFLEEFQPRARRFDLVTLCQTVDHLLDVAGGIQKVRSLLTSDGLFFVDIVDFRAAYLGSWCVEEAIKVDHPFYLTEATMKAYLFRAGFEILRVDYAADRLHLGYVCRLAEPMPDYLPRRHTVKSLLHEVRMVQNAPRSL